MDTTNTMNELVAPGTSAPTQEPTTLAEVIGQTPDEAEKPTTDQPTTPQKPLAEPKYLAGKRAEWEEAHRAEMDELRGQLSTLREYFINQEADKLVADGKIADRDMALKYLRATQGMPEVAPTPAQPVARDERGRFISQKPDATAAQTRAAELVAQADTILQSTGVDVMALYNTDLEVRQKVLNGEWSFVDVYKNTKKPEVPAVPTPMRSANGMGIGALDIRKMNSEQLAKLNAMLESGVKIDARK